MHEVHASLSERRAANGSSWEYQSSSGGGIARILHQPKCTLHAHFYSLLVWIVHMVDVRKKGEGGINHKPKPNKWIFYTNMYDAHMYHVI